MRVLLVEDDVLLGEGLKAGLKQAGYTVDWVQNGDDALHAVRVEPFDFVVLDLGLPGRPGLEVLRTARREGVDAPVLILTALDGVADRVQGLDSGADDYLSKPFDLDELCARLRAIQRRRQGRAAPMLRHGDIEVDLAARAVRCRDQAVSLSLSEYNLLVLLLENAGRVMPRARLEQALYGWEREAEGNSLEVFIHHLRRKLTSQLIRTVRGVGYTIDKMQ